MLDGIALSYFVEYDIFYFENIPVVKTMTKIAEDHELHIRILYYIYNISLNYSFQF
jgi:hypothetical protein